MPIKLSTAQEGNKHLEGEEGAAWTTQLNMRHSSHQTKTEKQAQAQHSVGVDEEGHKYL